MYQYCRLISGLLLLGILGTAPAHAALLSFVSGTIIQPDGANEGDTLTGGTTVKTGVDGLAMVEQRWRSDKPGYQCIKIAIFGYGQSYTVGNEETPGRCETTVPTSLSDIRDGEAFLAKETRYSDAAFDDPSQPDAVRRSLADWRSFDHWTGNAERSFTGDVVAVGGGKIRVRSPMSNRQISFAAQASSVSSPVALDTLVNKRIRVDYKLAQTGPRAIRIRLTSPLVVQPIPLSPGVLHGADAVRYSVVLTGYGDHKISVIKAVRAITGLGLKDAKEAVESRPYTVREAVSAEEARRIAAQLQEAGASTRIKPQP